MTFVSYPNIDAVSADGRFRVEVCGNASGDFFRDQSGFVYRLYMNKPRELVWEWKPNDEFFLADFPHEAWVDDEGWVVVRLHEWFHAGLLVLSPTGECCMHRSIRSVSEEEKGLLQEESDEHIGWTSAGPTWEVSSIAQFHGYLKRRYWSILTWWGQRIIVDLESGEPVEASTSQLRLVTQLEERQVLGKLAQSAEHLSSCLEPERHWWDNTGVPVYAAALHAGLMGLDAAIPRLRKLEACPVIGSSTTRSWLAIDSLPFRLVAKVSLLRLGVEPAWRPNYALRENATKRQCSYIDPAAARGTDCLKPGMTQREVLHRFGVPEFIDLDVWDYCLTQAGRVSTLRLHWSDPHKVSEDVATWTKSDFKRHRETLCKEQPVVERFEQLDTAAWEADPVREYALAHLY